MRDFFCVDENSDVSGCFVSLNPFQQNVDVKELYIKKVIYNNPVTIVFWNDGTKTMSKCLEGETYDKYVGLTNCLLKKLIGVKAIKNIVNDWIPEQLSLNNFEEVTLKLVRYNKKHQDA